MSETVDRRPEAGTEPVVVTEIGAGAADRERWDAYVRAHPEGSLFHESRWRCAVERCFPFRPAYLAAESGGALRGVLPLFVVDNPFAKPRLISVPMAVYGGVLADDDGVARVLVDAAAARADGLGASYVEYRHVRGLSLERLAPLDAYATFVAALPDDPEACLAGLPRKARAAARKAIRDYRLDYEVRRDGLDRFFDLFARNKRRLGSPIYPKRFFEGLLEELDADLLFVRVGDRIVSGVLSFYDRDTVIPYYSGADDRFQSLQFNNFMYLKLMEEGVRRGIRRFDFGRSRTGSGAFDFKKNQGFEPTPLAYQFDLRADAEIPNLTPDNPRFDFAQATWRRLPLPLVKALGPYLVRYFA